MVDELPTAILNFELPDELSEPIFQSRVGDVVESTPAQFLQSLASRSAAGSALPQTLDELDECGLPLEVLDDLHEIIQDSTGLVDAERDIVGLFIGLLARSPAGDGLDPVSREALCGPQLGDRSLRRERSRVVAVVARASADSWDNEMHPTGVSL